MTAVAALIRSLQQTIPSPAAGQGGLAAGAFHLVLPELPLPRIPPPEIVSPDAIANGVLEALAPIDAKTAALANALEEAEELCDAIAGVGDLAGDLLASGMEAVGEVIIGEIQEAFTEAFEGLDEVVGDVVQDIVDAADEVVSAVDDFIAPAEEIAGIYTDFKPMFQAMAALQ